MAKRRRKSAFFKKLKKSKKAVVRQLNKRIVRPLVRKGKKAGLIRRKKRPRLSITQKWNRAGIKEAAKRRGQHRLQKDVVLEWYGDVVESKIRTLMMQRMQKAVKSLRRQVVENISSPAAYYMGPRGGIRVSRSKPGMFPFLDTGQLAQDIFGYVWETSPGIFDGFVATPTKYGFILETSTRLNRSFLRKTLLMHQDHLRKILVAPIQMGAGTDKVFLMSDAFPDNPND